MPPAQVLGARDALEMIQAVLFSARVIDRPARGDHPVLPAGNQAVRRCPPAVLPSQPEPRVLLFEAGSGVTYFELAEPHMPANRAG